MNEDFVKILLSQSQPMKIITFCLIPCHLGFFIPWNSAALIFSTPVLLLFAIANLGHITIIEWSPSGNLKFRKLIMIYFIFVGGFATEFPSLSADTLENLQHSANQENIPLKNASDEALAFALFGSIFLDVYYIVGVYKIVSRMLYAILSRIL